MNDKGIIDAPVSKTASIFCETCCCHQPMIIDPMRKDDLNPHIWGDLVCYWCKTVIASISVKEEGIYDFVKIGVEHG
jgi:hypothetical protein